MTQKRSKLRVPERTVLRACIEWLELNHVLFIRHNALKPVQDRYGKHWAPLRASQLGISDLIIFPEPGMVVFAECKSSFGKLSPAQQRFKEAVTCQGWVYLTVRSVEDLMMMPRKLT